MKVKCDIDKKQPSPDHKQDPSDFNFKLQPDQILEQIVKINGEKSTKVYQRKQLLGKGGFANCYLTEQHGTNRKAATKIISKTLLQSFRTKLRLNNQIKLHKTLRHENVVEFYHYFEDQDNVYILLQLCEGGCLNELARIRNELTTPEIQSLVYGICQGLKYLHSRGIIHRDMKLGNVFLDSHYKVKIGDFGLAAKLQFKSECKRTVCGTPNYIAPEVLSGKGYHFEVDVWALGIIIFTLFFTVPPFETDSANTTYQKIRTCNYVFPKVHKAPPEAIHLIKGILINNPAQRLTLDEILESPFMRLGLGIPLELPSIVNKRQPTKKDFGKVALLKMDERMGEKYEKRMKTLEKEYSKEGKNNSRENSSKQNQMGPSIRVTKIEEFQENKYIYQMGKQQVGVLDKEQSVIYSIHEGKDQSGVKRIYLLKSKDNEEQISLNDCKYRVWLNLWKKQLVRSNRVIVEASIHIKKVHKYKNMILIKLSDNKIQVIFGEGDGFVWSRKKNELIYFMEMGIEKDVGMEWQMLLSMEKGQTQKIRKVQQKMRIKEQGVLWKKIGYIKGIIEETSHRKRKDSE